MAVWYIDSAQWSAVTAWATGTAKSAGNLIRQNATPTVGNERVFVCIVAGTTHATTEPTWTVTKGSKTTDNTVTWQEVTGQPGVNGDLTNCPLSSSVRSTNPGLGKIIQNNAGTHLFICSTAGTCGAGEPSYNTTAGQTTTDSGCTWTSLGTVGSFTAFLAPHARLGNAHATNWGASGDTFYIGDDHAESTAGIISISFKGTQASRCYNICVDHTKAAPYASGDLKVTATITCSGSLNTSLTIAGNYIYGVEFIVTANNVNSLIIITANSGTTVFKKCKFRHQGNVATNAVRFTQTGTTAPLVILDDCGFQFGSTGDLISSDIELRILNSSSLLLGATVPTAIFASSAVGSVYADGCDFSSFTSSSIITSTVGRDISVTLNNCKLPSGFDASGTEGSAGAKVILTNCYTDSTNWYNAKGLSEGLLTTVTNPRRTGGASDGTTAVAWKIATNSQITWEAPFESIPIYVWNATTGSNRTVTLYGIWDSASLPNNDDIWVEARYLGTSGSPIASFKSQTKADIFASNAALSADSTSAWDSGATARANSTAYSLGNVIKVPSAPKRIFFCTTAGTSASAQPASGVTWTARTSAADNLWFSLCWSPELSLFCAVAQSGTGNRVMTSPDGITWTTRTSAADNAWLGVAWSPELSLFCAVAQSGTGNRVMTSPDGITWTTRTSAADNNWLEVAWSPNLRLFCAVANSGTGNRVMTSPDGITWTTRTSAADNNWVSVCWAPGLGLFCAVANSGTGNRVMTSPDGITWTTRTSAADNDWRKVCWSPELSLFCAVAQSGTGNRVMTSPDGITWTTRTSAVDNNWYSVCWSGSIFVAVAMSGTGNRVMTSPDGITWTTRTSAADNGWREIVYAPELGLFCVVGDTGTGNRVMTSPDTYGAAAPGATVTDGSAVFRAARRFILTVTLTSPQPQLAGYVRAYVMAAKASTTFYVDPYVTLS